MKIKHIIYSLFLGLAFTACAEVDYCDSEHPHKGSAKFTFDFGEKTGDKPETMGVITYRVVGQSKRLLKVNSTTFDIAGAQSVDLEVGDYKFITFPYDETELEYSDVFKFITEKSADFPLQEVCYAYKQYSKDDPKLRKKLVGWDDYNQYSQYIQPDVNILFYDTTQIVRIDHEKEQTIPFKPKSLSQTIDFYFNIKKKVDESPFVIDKVWAEVGGVPRKINLSNGHLDITKTSKIMFPIDMTDANGNTASVDETPDTETNTSLRCHGQIHVSGLVNVQRNTGESLEDVHRKMYGPGIMQVIIYGHAIDSDTGRRINRRWQGVINLYEALKKARLTVTTVDGKYVKRNTEYGTVNIGTPLNMDGNSILRDNSGGDGLEEWIPTVSINLDI